MATCKHTPGPWFVDTRFPDMVRAASGTVIAIFDNASREANARLGAAAPDLLAEVKEFRRTVAYYMAREAHDGDDEGIRLKRIKLTLLDALIAAAEG